MGIRKNVHWPGLFTRNIGQGFPYGGSCKARCTKRCRGACMVMASKMSKIENIEDIENIYRGIENFSFTRLRKYVKVYK